MLKSQPFRVPTPRARVLLRVLPAALSAVLAASLLAVLVPGADAAGSTLYGQTQRFGGFDVSASEGKTPTEGKFLEPRGFALDTHDSTGGAHDTSVYVLDRTSASDSAHPSEWRIQKFSESGQVLGTTTFSLENEKFTATAVEALAVDHTADRLYALVIGQPSGEDIDEPVAQELIAWSITPNGSKQLVAASGLPSDPLGTGAGLVSSKSQLQPSSGTPLYQPQGIAVDPSGGAGSSPVAIEATDLAAGSISGGTPSGNTVVQQVATSGMTGELLGKWSSASVASQLGGRSWGPGGISLNPDGSLNVLLNDVGENGKVYAVNLSADLSTATVLDSPASLPESGDFDQLPFAGIDPPFGKALTGRGISQVQGSGPELVELSAPGSDTTGGLFASLFETPNGKDIQAEREFYFHEGFEEIQEGSNELHFQANLGVRLLQPEAGGSISDPKGKTIVDTLANPTLNAPCDFGSGSSLALAAGNEGALWVLVQGPLSELVHGPINPSNTATGGQVVELEPGAGTACPQPSGTFTMQPAGGPSQAGNTELTIAAGTIVKFDAAGLETQGGTPYAYEWQLNSKDVTNGEPVNEMLAPQFDVPPATAEYTYTTPGIYKIKLTFRSDYGSYTTAEGTVNVLGELVEPTAQFNVTSGPPVVGAPVEVNASGSLGGSGKITGYEWNWGDGSPTESFTGEATAAHGYSKAGEYTITLVVTNSLGQKSAAATLSVVVASASESNPPVGGTQNPNPGSTSPGTQTTTTGSTTQTTGSTTSKTSTVKPPLTNAQKLSQALKACKKKPKKQRASCEKQARKKYSQKPKKTKKKKK